MTTRNNIQTINESGVETAKKIRKALKAAFPGVKFSVRSDYNSVRISWIDACTVSEVEEVTNKFSSGSFNGYEDIYEYSSYEYEGKHYCGAKYIFTNRELSDEYRTILEAKAEQMGYVKEWNTYQVWQLNKAEEAIKAEQQTISTPKESTTHEDPSNDNNTVTVTLNEEKSGIEIQFAEKPSEDILESLRANGFKYYHKLNKKWIAKQTPERIAFAYSLIPSQSEVVEEAEHVEVIENVETIQGQTTVETTEQKQIAIKSITFLWLESNLVKDNTTVFTFAEANNIIHSIAHDNGDMGYTKTAFIIEWADGRTHEGRIDVDYKHANKLNPIGEHVKYFYENLAGIRKPDSWTWEQHHNNLKHMYNIDNDGMEEMKNILNTYLLDDITPVPEPTKEAVNDEQTPTNKEVKYNNVISLSDFRKRKAV